MRPTSPKYRTEDISFYEINSIPYQLHGTNSPITTITTTSLRAYRSTDFHLKPGVTPRCIVYKQKNSKLMAWEAEICDTNYKRGIIELRDFFSKTRLLAVITRKNPRVDSKSAEDIVISPTIRSRTKIST
ncbi:hypothetical protein SARC_00988 [Sphaeroforma arctica JP610]|uniref:Uncharacterized protein n=1 Tax=Sphaeroforma arctica JP610 TaxID=667725 RepID=A0A0L0GF05_9EUKA|nr:hypothetical protein SARC_00988 [Sphaeroforma arctica JP610]KNC86893.1 hypothetical protein SARC_00988 [Sphaeroforma arctica JP610]|eukprot:XP_014160795.1 hypothetical protein SARC_00988 [Sphaeroforma arctica JP610]